MAYTIGINKNMGQMFADLETLMLQEGWEKLSRNTIGSFTTSRGYKYTGGGYAYPGRYSDTTALKLDPGQVFTHSTIGEAASETFYNDYPKEFSISFWANFSESRSTQLALICGESDNKIFGFRTTSVFRTTPYISIDKERVLGESTLPFKSLLYYMKYNFTHKDGKGWELFTFTYSSSLKEIKLYINGQLCDTGAFPLGLTAYTFYGALRGIKAAWQTIIFDEIVVWNKVLTLEEIESLFLKTSKVEASDAYVFEKYTQDIGVLFGGVFKSTTSQGTDIICRVGYNTSNNIELNSYTVYSNPLSNDLDLVSYPTHFGGQEGTYRCLAGVSATSSTLKKYWLMVNKDRVVISFKLHDPASLRTTPLYQSGYIGKLKSLGNDGINVFIAGTTTSNTYLWTTVNSSTFLSGITYSTNNSYRLGGSYYNGVVGSINTNLTSLYSIANTTFLAGINVSYSATALGSLDGVYLCSSTQASPEDLITISGTDYLVLPNADTPNGQSYIVLKLA